MLGRIFSDASDEMCNCSYVLVYVLVIWGTKQLISCSCRYRLLGFFGFFLTKEILSNDALFMGDSVIRGAVGFLLSLGSLKDSSPCRLGEFFLARSPLGCSGNLEFVYISGKPFCDNVRINPN